MVRMNTIVNGVRIDREIDANISLLDFLRDELGLVGTNRSCDVQVCGSCTVLVDGLPVSSCTFLANEADGAQVETIEGIRDTEFYRRAEAAFVSHAAVQCGFCTPGFVMTLKAMVDDGVGAEEAQLRRSLSGNLCRCTGYRSILDAAAEIVSDR